MKRRIKWIVGIVLSVLLSIFPIYVLRYAMKAVKIVQGFLAYDGDLKFFEDAVFSGSIAEVAVAGKICIGVLVCCFVLFVFCVVKLCRQTKQNSNG